MIRMPSYLGSKIQSRPGGIDDPTLASIGGSMFDPDGIFVIPSVCHPERLSSRAFCIPSVFQPERLSSRAFVIPSAARDLLLRKHIPRCARDDMTASLGRLPPPGRVVLLRRALLSARRLRLLAL